MTAERDNETRDRRFDPYRIPVTEKARRLAYHTALHVETLEEMLNLRERKRRAADRPIFQATVSAVISDVVHRHLTAPGKWIAIPLSNRVLGYAGRYRTRVLGQTLPHILDRLARPQLRCIELRKGEQRFFGPGRVTTIRIGRTLKRQVEEEGYQVSDFGRGGTEELVILKRPKEGFWDNGEWIEYDDSPTTQRYRDELRRINSWLAKADVEFFDGGDDVDLQDRVLRRYFTGDFQHGGRLFGGFWQPLPKRRRFDGLSINGDGIAELDFGQMATRLAYARAGVTPPAGDLYAIPLLNLVREGTRDGVKAVMNAMLYSAERLTRFPPNSRKGLRGSFEGTEKAILLHHASIAHLFYKGVGMELMFDESEILVKVLLECERRGVVALPIHDAVLVARSTAEEVRRIMLEVFRAHTGLDAHVDVVCPTAR